MKWSIIKHISAVMHATEVQVLARVVVNQYTRAPYLLSYSEGWKPHQMCCSDTKGDMKLELVICPLPHHEKGLVPSQLRKLHVCTPHLLEAEHFTIHCALWYLNASDIIGSSQDFFRTAFRHLNFSQLSNTSKIYMQQNKAKVKLRWSCRVLSRSTWSHLDQRML